MGFVNGKKYTLCIFAQKTGLFKVSFCTQIRLSVQALFVMSSKVVWYSTLVTSYKSVLSSRENVVSTDRVPVMQRVSSGHRSVRADVASSLRVTTRDNRQQWPQPFVWLTDVCAQMGRTVRVTVSPLTINGCLQNCLLRLSSSLVHTHTNNARQLAPWFCSAGFVRTIQSTRKRTI